MGGESKSSDEFLSFVGAAIRSICALELLLYVRRERPRIVRIDELVRELRSSGLAVAQALDELTRFGLVAEFPQVGYSYQPTSPALDALCEELEIEYVRKPLAVIRAILDAHNEKLRIFADAFRLPGRDE